MLKMTSSSGDRVWMPRTRLVFWQVSSTESSSTTIALAYIIPFIFCHTRGVAFFGYNFSLRLHGRHGIRGTRTSVKCASVRPVLAPFFARAYRPKSWKLSLLSSAPRKVLGVWCEDIPVRLGTELGILEEHHTPLAASLHSLTLAGKNKGS